LRAARISERRETGYPALYPVFAGYRVIVTADAAVPVDKVFRWELSSADESFRHPADESFRHLYPQRTIEDLAAQQNPLLRSDLDVGGIDLASPVFTQALPSLPTPEDD
jgi:hypothetical protein